MSLKKRDNIQFPIIFLDIDGVLNTWNAEQREDNPWGPQFHFDEAAMAHLTSLVFDFDARIVVSSSWRHFQPRDLAHHIFLHNLKQYQLQDYVLDVTPSCEDPSFGERRSHEIRQWLEEHPHLVHSYVILDDEPLTMDLIDHQVLCEVIQGFGDPTLLEKAKVILATPL